MCLDVDRNIPTPGTQQDCPNGSVGGTYSPPFCRLLLTVFSELGLVCIDVTADGSIADASTADTVPAAADASTADSVPAPADASTADTVPAAADASIAAAPLADVSIDA